MNKVVSINLNGNVFQLEEPGFAALSSYLEQAKARLIDNPDQAEIMADIEQAIADKLQRFLSVHKSVVNSEEVNTVLKEMGPVESNAAASADAATNAGPKRLYRIPDGEILGGVANGLAVYFNVDVVPIRILMVMLLVLTGGGFALGYVLAWMFIPLARTPEEQAKAYGEPFNAEEIIARTKAAVEKSHAEGIRQWKEWKRQWRKEQRAHVRAYKYKYRYDWNGPYYYRHSTFGELFWLIVFTFFVWLGYHHVPLIHQFLNDVWNVVLNTGNWIAAQIAAHQK